MSQLEDIEKAILEILNSSKASRFQDTKDALLRLFKDNMILNTKDVVITYEDFQRVVSNAKTSYSKETFPIHVKDSKNQGKQLETTENANFLLFESILGFLISKELFKNKPTFNKGR